MKFLLTILCFLLATQGHTQSSDRSFITKTEFVIDSAIANENVSAAAMSAFNKVFKDVENVRWHATDEGSTVKFDRVNTKYHVFYNKRGKWQSTIQYLPVEMVPRWVVGRVNSDFRHFSIFFAQFVKTRAGSAYLVKIEKGNDWKFVSITPMATEVLGEYVRN